VRRAACLFALAVTACSSTPTAPSSFRRLNPEQPLTPGRYAFAVLAGTSIGPGQQPSCTIGGDPNGSLPHNVSAFMMTAVSDGVGGLTFRPESDYDLGLTMSLRQTIIGAAEGTVRGTARDPVFGQTVTFGGDDPSQPATLNGFFGASFNLVAGEITGRVVFARGGVTHSCANNGWILNRLTEQ
jgi:hypothetical protein